MTAPTFEPSEIDIQTVNTTTVGGEYRFAQGPMELRGRFIFDHGRGGYSAQDMRIELNREEFGIVQEAIDSAVARYRAAAGGALD